jgi:dTDP-D-glucose 4,6-dehydratase
MQYPEKLIPKFITSITNKQPCTIHGTGETRRSFVYVDDVSRAMHIVLEKGVIGKIYNIGTKNEYNVNEIFEILRT